MKKISDFLAGIPMTVAAGLFLAASLVSMFTDLAFPIDPAWGTIVICGLPLLYLALTRLFFQRWISSALLISIAMVASIAIGEIFAAGEVAFIMSIGAILEDMTVERVKKGIGKLIALAPETGRRLVAEGGDTREEIVGIEQIRMGDTLRILPGERIPVDSEIVQGDTSVDQSVMTGESLPVDKSAGDEVFSGTMNCFGAVDIRARKVGRDSSLQKMIDMVQEAENRQAPMQRIVDRWATWLVPIALAIAIAAYLATGNIVRAVTVLVVFCPCALALATPTSVMAAIGQAARYGVLIKSGEALEKMGKVDCVVFDKTGTLTFGTLRVSDAVPLSPGVSRERLLSVAASVEQRSEHPLGKAILQHAKTDGIPLEETSSFQMIPGKGVRSTLEGATALCGNALYLRENGVAIDDEAAVAAETLQNEGKASLFVALGGTCIGLVALSDTQRPASRDMIESLRKMCTDVVLLTGDHRRTADSFARQVGIENVRAELLPGDKVTSIETLREEGKHVCMIGDGVNDAPALKTADVGIAMGSIGSDIAIEAADIALMGDDIEKIPYLKRLSNATIRTIKGNITASMAINFVAIVLSVMGVLTPVSGAVVHNAGSVLVVLNAALLYDRKFV